MLFASCRLRWIRRTHPFGRQWRVSLRLRGQFVLSAISGTGGWRRIGILFHASEGELQFLGFGTAPFPHRALVSCWPASYPRSLSLQPSKGSWQCTFQHSLSACTFGEPSRRLLEAIRGRVEEDLLLRISGLLPR